MKKLLHLFVFAAVLGSSGWGFEIGGFSMSLFRITFILLLLATILDLIRQRKLRKVSFRPITWANILLYFGWMLVSLIGGLWAKSKSDWLFDNFYLIIGSFSIFMLLYHIRDIEDLIGVLKAFFYGGVVHLCIGWYEILTGNYFFVTDPHYLVRQSNLALSSLTNQNNLSVLMIAVCVVSMALILWEKSKNRRLIYILGFLFASMLVVHNQSRGSLLALVFVVFLFFTINIMMTFWRPRIYTLLLVTGIFLAIGLFFSPPIQLKLAGFMASLHPMTILSWGSDQNRVKMLANGWLALVDSVGLGVGAGNIENYMETIGPFPTNSLNIHNWWGEIGANYGIVFLLIYCLVYLLTTVSLLRIFWMNPGKRKNQLGLIGFAFFLSFPIISVVASSMISFEWLYVFFGIWYSYIKLSEYQSSYCSDLFSQRYTHLLSKEEQAWLTQQKEINI